MESSSSQYPLLPEGSARIDKVASDSGVLPSDQRDKDKAEKIGNRKATAVDVKTGEAIEVEAMPLNEEPPVPNNETSDAQNLADDAGNGSNKKDNFTEDTVEFATGAAFAASADFVADHLKGKRKREGEDEEQKEKPFTRTFLDIQTELKSYIDNPNPEKEKELKRQRASLIREAKDVGVFETVKIHMERAQALSTFEEAEQTIKQINVERIENEAEGLVGWNKNFEGMIGEYVEVAILNMDLAMAEEGGGNYVNENARNRSISNLRRQIAIRGWGMPPPNLNRLAREYLDSSKQQKDHNEDLVKILTDIRSLQQEQALSQEQQLELMKKGLKGFIQGVVTRAHVNPEQYDQQLPPWFEQLSPELQNVFTNILHINYLAAVKRDSGMSSLDGWVGTPGLRVERDALEYMNRNLPGFRIALATMSSEIFVRGADHLIISGAPQSTDSEGNITPASGGYSIVGSESSLKKYKKDLQIKVKDYLDDTFGDRYEKRFRVTNNDLAALAVSSIDNFFFAFGAYDSGDERRAISPGDGNVYSEAIRTFFMPGIKAEAKWKLRKDFDKERSEDFGGPLGAYIRENSVMNNSFRNKLKNGEIQFIPKRLFYSGIDFTEFGRGSSLEGVTLAQALVSAPTIRIGQNGLQDFRDGADAIPFDQLGAYEILGNYADTRGSAIKLFKHITGSDPAKDRADRNGVINALLKLKGDKMLEPITRNEDFVLACIAMIASPESGLIRGTDKTVLNVDPAVYRTRVFNATQDLRLFEGMKYGARRRILKRLYYDVPSEKMRRANIAKAAARNSYKYANPGLINKTINWIGKKIKR